MFTGAGADPGVVAITLIWTARRVAATEEQRKIRGNAVDIHVDSAREAKKFGRKKVRIEVLERGEGDRKSAKQEPLPDPEDKAPALK